MSAPGAVVLDDLSSAGIDAAIERNPVEYWRAWCSHWPDADFRDDADRTWFIVGVPALPFNQIIASALDEQGLDQAIESALQPFRERSLPTIWSITPSTRPPAFAPSLERAGLRLLTSMPGMAFELDRLPALETPGAFAVERVKDDRGLETWGEMYHEGFGLPDGFAGRFVATFRKAGLDDAAPFRHYVGLLDGEPVACSTMFFGAGVAGLWHIATLEGARRRGIGAAMTLAPMRDARELGYRVASLYASEMGAPVYARLGFREYHHVTQYVWPPEARF